MDERLRIKCLLCLITGPAELVSPVLRDDTSGNHKVYRCLTCGHAQVFPLPTQEEDDTFYDNDMQTKNLMGKTDFELAREKALFDTKRRLQLANTLMPDIPNRGG